jgi:lipoprotein-releasing system ATP-binding protein
MTARQQPSAGSNTLSFFSARGITKKYVDGSRRIDVLNGVNLDLHQGEMIAVVGASGTGKTTLLHILGTLDRPSAGSLFYNNKDVFAKDDITLSAFRNRTIGFVFQFHHLLPEFTALENVMMPGLIAGRPAKQLQHESRLILAQVELDHRIDHKVGELSGGEQQRVALADGLLQEQQITT